MSVSIRTLAVLTLALAGCKSSTAPDDSNSTTLASPKVGSYIQYALSVAWDTSDQEYFFSDTVIATGITQFGKSNVTQFSNLNPFLAEFLPQFVAYEANGDLSFYYPKGSGGTWITVPLASKGIRQSATSVSKDTSWYTFKGDADRTYRGLAYKVSEFKRIEGESLNDQRADEYDEVYDRRSGLLLRREYIDTSGNDAYVLEVSQVSIK